MSEAFETTAVHTCSSPCLRHSLACFILKFLSCSKIQSHIDRPNGGQPPEKASKHAHAVMVVQVLARDPRPVGRESNEDSDGGDFATRTFFETLFLFADKNGKGELVVEDLETLFQARSFSCVVLCCAVLCCLLFRLPTSQTVLYPFAQKAPPKHEYCHCSLIIYDLFGTCCESEWVS